MNKTNVPEGFAERLKAYDMPYVTSEGTESPSTIFRFEEADEDDCSLSVMVHIDKVEVRRVVGRATITQSYSLEDIDDNFFELLKEHHDTLKDLLRMRERLLGPAWREDR